LVRWLFQLDALGGRVVVGARSRMCTASILRCSSRRGGLVVSTSSKYGGQPCPGSSTRLLHSRCMKRLASRPTLAGRPRRETFPVPPWTSRTRTRVSPPYRSPHLVRRHHVAQRLAHLPVLHAGQEQPFHVKPGCRRLAVCTLTRTLLPAGTYVPRSVGVGVTPSVALVRASRGTAPRRSL